MSNNRIEKSIRPVVKTVSVEIRLIAPDFAAAERQAEAEGMDVDTFLTKLVVLGLEGTK